MNYVILMCSGCLPGLFNRVTTSGKNYFYDILVQIRTLITENNFDDFD